MTAVERAVPEPLALHVLELHRSTRQPTDPGLRARVSRRLTRSVLARQLNRSAAGITLLRTPSGRPVLTGETASDCCFSVSHDDRVIGVAYHPAGCGFDVESADPASLLDVAERFCAPAELATGLRAADCRALWSAKESVAKAAGTGLAARLSTITFAGDPQRDWVPAYWRGAPTGLLTRVVGYPGRHVAVSVRTSAPPAVSVTLWRATGHTGRTDGSLLAAAGQRDVGRFEPTGGTTHTTQPWLPAGLRRHPAPWTRHPAASRTRSDRRPASPPTPEDR